MRVGGFGLDGADDGNNFVEVENGLVGSRAGGSVDDVVCLAELLGDAETDVAGGTDDENLDHCGMCVFYFWSGRLELLWLLEVKLESVEDEDKKKKLKRRVVLL